MPVDRERFSLFRCAIRVHAAGMTIFRALALWCLPFFLVSCLDYREELWIEANGSGKIHATISINTEIANTAGGGTGQPDKFEAQLKEVLDATEGATLDQYQSYTQGAKRVYDFKVSFHDLRRLKPAIAAGQGTVGGVFGDFEIEKIPDGRLAVKRVISAEKPAAAEPSAPASDTGDALGEALGKAMGGLLANALLSGYQLEYVTHFPTEVIGANTSEIDRETNTVTWRFPLSQVSQGPVTMTAEIKRPGLWMWWALGALALIVTAAILVPALRKQAAV